MNLLDISLRLRNNPTFFAWRWKRLEREGLMRRVVRPDDDAVIEGFPRSANTYATYAFMHAQRRSVKVGNHFHSPAQFLLAAKYRVPAMLVLRKPDDAVLSLMLYEPGLSPEIAFRRYIGFHEPLERVTAQFVVAPFEEVISNFNHSIAALNRRFDTKFALMTESDDTAVAQLISTERARKIARVPGFTRHEFQATLPSAQKEAAKLLMREKIDAPRYSALRNDAGALYLCLMKTRPT